MKLIIFIILVLNFSNAFSGELKKISKNTLSFIGTINEDELDKFKEVFSEDITRIIVDSGGGRTIVGFRIGQLISLRDIEVVVKGRCMSSCANYIFAGAKKRTIDNRMEWMDFMEA